MAVVGAIEIVQLPATLHLIHTQSFLGQAITKEVGRPGTRVPETALLMRWAKDKGSQDGSIGAFLS